MAACASDTRVVVLGTTGWTTKSRFRTGCPVSVATVQTTTSLSGPMVSTVASKAAPGAKLVTRGVLPCSSIPASMGPAGPVSTAMAMQIGASRTSTG